MKSEEQLQIEKRIQNNPFDARSYYELGICLEENNIKQAFLCYQNAQYYCKDNDLRRLIFERKNMVLKTGGYVPPCSIVILNYNGREMTCDCIDSILKTTSEETREIIIVDNGSSDDSLEYLRKINDIVLVENGYNAGFPKGCNIGVEVSQSENDIFLLNNDALLCANSLFWLRMGLYQSEDFGAVGAVTNHCPNGQAVVEDGKERNYYEEQALEINVPMDKPYEERLFLIGFALLIKRTVLDKVGCLDEAFYPGHFEDDDLGIRILLEGYHNILVRNAFVIHWGLKSFGKDLVALADILNRNCETLGRKYNFNRSIIDTQFRNIDWVNESHLCDLPKNAKVLVINCELGTFFGKLKREFPELSFAGIEKEERTASFCRMINSADIRFYSQISDNPFEGVKFDLILMDVQTVEKSDLYSFLGYIANHLADNGVLRIRYDNALYYKNMLTLICKEDYETEQFNKLYWDKEVNEMLKNNGFDLDNWTFFFLPPDNQNDVEKVEKLQELMPEQRGKKLNVRSIVVSAHKRHE